MTMPHALAYSFFFGLLHGIVPDEHTWPITLSYALGGASGRAGLRAGLYFSAAFTLQRAILPELAYLALTPFLLNTAINGIAYAVVGIVMSAAGWVVLHRQRYPHAHLLGNKFEKNETTEQLRLLPHAVPANSLGAPPIHWAAVHGFIAGFGFGAFSLFVNTVAAPAMTGPYLGFLPGLVFGLGTMVVLILLGWLFGSSLRWVRAFTDRDVRRIGSSTGGRTLFFGGMLFCATGISVLAGLDRYVSIDKGYTFIALFMVAIAVPSLILSIRETLADKRRNNS